MAFPERFLKLFSLFLSAVFLQSQIFLYAAPASPLLPASPQTSRIGIVAAVHGAVNIAQNGAVGKIAESGMPVFLGDEVKTGPEGTLQILLLDETVFKIGPNSAIVIDKFIYNPADDSGQVKATVVKGVFRFVTGKIARKKPSSMEVELPSGVIGIRGTIVAGQSQGGKSLVVLLGPGEKNNTGSTNGRITVSNETSEGRKQVVVNKSGFGTRIEGKGKAPVPVFRVGADDLAALSNALGAQPGSGNLEGGEGESATEASGEDSAEAAESSEALGDLQALGSEADYELSKSAQESAEAGDVIRDGVATRRNLNSVSSGQYHYSDTGNALVILAGGTGPIPGTYDINVDIDFGARKVGGGQSKLFINNNSSTGVPAPSMLLTPKDFGSGADPATFSFSGNPANTAACVGTNCSATVDVTFNNQGGVVASSETSSVRFYIGAFTFGGSGSANQQSGLSP